MQGLGQAGLSVPLTADQLKAVIQGPGDTEWRYEMRRECQEILPGLWLGPFAASKSLETLQGLGISHILCIRDAKEAFSVKPRFPDLFQYLVLNVEDNEEQNLIRLFPTAKNFIDTAISQQGGKVLVHCNGGISLSPAFVVMFVMQHYQISWEDALHLVQNRRYCISPNGGFLTQIKEYEAIYRATVVIGTQAPPPHLLTNSSSSSSNSTSGSAFSSSYLDPSHQAFQQNVLISRPTRRKREVDDDDLEDVEDRKRALVDSVGDGGGRDGDGDVTMDS